MDTTKKVDNIQTDSLELVLEEFAGEQKSNTQSLNDLVTAVNGLTDKLAGFEKKLDIPKPVNVSVDIKPVQEIIGKGITDMVLAAAAQPKNLTRKFQVLLFPEQDAKLFYKIVFGRWFLMLVIMLLVTCLYKFCIHWSDNQKEVRLKQLENDRIKKAWNYLYHHQKKSIRRLMDSVYTKTSYS